MELYQLQSFLAVARYGSLSRAAASRHISLPGISKHIKMLEDELGFQLFTRSSRGMELTENGRQVLSHAERIQREVEDLVSLARQAPPLRIGLNLTPDFLQLARLQQLLVRQHPASRVILTNHNSGTLLHSLQEGELDLCLAFGNVPPKLLSIPIRTVAMVLMVPTGLAIDHHDLSRQCWIVNTADCPFKPPLEEFWRMHRIIPKTTILAQDLSRKELVAQGLGIGFLEPQDGLALITSGLGRRHGTYSLEVPLSAVYREPAFAADAELLRSYIQDRYDRLMTETANTPVMVENRN